ncbi:MAG: serine/threonine protein kinase [Motiliproteus sp.]|nr:serine/threonine protein kinase [Motiliproteus sp.]MCW9050786.1 serine/threonine protein kinase [Motiliproteus sp.]
MHIDAVPHPYESLTPDAVLDAVESLGYLSDARILALNSYENRVYQVGIEDQPAAPLIAKFYRPERWSEAQILEEHQFTQALLDGDLPVVPPIKDETGKSLHQHRQFSFALFLRRGGHAPELDNLDNLYILGRTMGRIHLIGQSQPFQHRPTIDIESFGHASRNYLLENRWLPEDQTYEYQRISEQLLEKIEDKFEQLENIKQIRLHGDCHPGNILWRESTPHFVDFDDCRMGPAIQDLWMLLSGDRNQQLLQINELIEGYEEFLPFNRAELNLVEPLRALRVMHYAAWLARRWEDPAFPTHFPWFNTHAYWMGHVMELQELCQAVDRPPLQVGAF